MEPPERPSDKLINPPSCVCDFKNNSQVLFCISLASEVPDVPFSEGFQVQLSLFSKETMLVCLYAQAGCNLAEGKVLNPFVALECEELFKNTKFSDCGDL